MDKNDEVTWRAVAAIVKASYETEGSESLDSAAERLKRHLMAAAVETGKEHNARSSAARGAHMTSLLDNGIYGVEPVFSWLTRIGALTQKEIAVVRRSRIVVVDDNGRIVVGKPRLGIVAAAAMIAGASFLAGAWIACVLIFPWPPIAVPLSLALGGLAGWAIGRVADLSFRAANLRKKILAAAPWLDATVAQ